jgi:hypothetical protein
VYPELRPTLFKSDYEKAAINAVKGVYPGVVCEGDSFHFVQAIMKKVKEAGLLRMYLNDEETGDIEIYDQVRLLMTPMFVPVNRVEEFWHETIKRLVVREELAPIVDYVERTWIGKIISSNSRITS